MLHASCARGPPHVQGAESLLSLFCQRPGEFLACDAVSFGRLAHGLQDLVAHGTSLSASDRKLTHRVLIERVGDLLRLPPFVHPEGLILLVVHASLRGDLWLLDCRLLDGQHARLLWRRFLGWRLLTSYRPSGDVVGIDPVASENVVGIRPFI